MRKIKLKLTPFEAKLMFNILIDKQKQALEEIDSGNDEDDYYNFIHGELEKILYKLYDKMY